MKNNLFAIEQSFDEIKPLIVVPTYNNEATLQLVIEGCLELHLPILVVNDGSWDDSTEIIARLPVESIRHDKNRGKGVAIKSALDWASKHSYTHIITIDADGQHDPADINKLIQNINKSPWSIIIGSRDLDASAAPGKSRFGRKFSNFWIWITACQVVRDSQSGLRAYPVDALKLLKFKDNRYDFEIEALIKCAWAGMMIECIDVNVHYSEQTKASSHFKSFWDNLRISETFARSFFRNLFPWPHKTFRLNNETGRITLKYNSFKEIILQQFKQGLTTKEISQACFVGILLGTLPLIACHTIAIIYVSALLRLNKFIALNFSSLCMPPFVPALAIETGYFVRNGELLTVFNWQTLGYEIHHRLIDYIIGATLLAPILAFFAIFIVYSVLSIFSKINLRKEV